MARSGKHELVWWRNMNRVADIFVMIAMSLVAVALGIALNLQFGLTQWLAAVAAITVFGGLLALHAAVRRAEEVDVLHAEIWRLETAVARAQGAVAQAGLTAATGPATAPGRTPLGAPSDARDPRLPQPKGRQAGGKPMPGAPGHPGAPGAPSAGGAPGPAAKAAQPAQTPAPPQARPVKPSDLRARPRSAAEALAVAPMPNASGQMPSAGTSLPSGPKSDAGPAQARPGSYGGEAQAFALDPQGRRREAPDAPARGTPAMAARAPAQAGDRAYGMAASAPPTPSLERPQMPERAPSPRDSDVAMIQALIKKLADEVNGVGSGSPTASPVASAADQGAIEASLAALRSTSDAMRAGDPSRRAVAPGSAGAGQAPLTPPPVGPAQTRLAALAEAITAGRIEVFLEPILGLADQRTRHYEVVVRLRGRGGEMLPPPESISEISGTGLLPLLDAARLSPAAQIGRRFAEKGREGSLFSPISGESLGNQQFLADFAAAYRDRESLAGRLVMTFAQSDVRSFAPRDWQTVLEMRDLGFRFAIQAVTDLDMDFEALKSAGFDFVKLDAQVFLEGLPLARGVVPANDICRHLAGLGLTLIVGNIADEGQLARVFGFGVLFGQGQLFGGPRPVKVQVASRASHAAA